MNRADAHPPRPRYGPCHALFLLLPACFHTEYLQDDAGVGHDDAAGHDAAMVDQDAAGPPSDAFSYTSCPSTYDRVLLPGLTHYRLIKTDARAWEHSDACNGDSSDLTHLAVVETTAEYMRIQALVDQQPQGAIAGNAVLIGGVQLNNATEPDKSWLGFDGNPLINAWNNVGDQEPNDFDNDESNHQEQFIAIAAGKNGLNDADGKDPTKPHGALCECDGHKIAGTAAAAVDSYRP
jgi:hypothetical protein